MATGTLGKLEISVLAEIAGLVSDLGKAQTATANFAKEAKANSEAAASAIESVGDSIKQVAELAGIGFTFEGLKSLVSTSLEAAETVNHLTQALGVSADTIQTLSFAAGKVGSDMESATTALARLERSAEQAAAGSEQQVEAFRAIGISASQLGELLKSPDDLIQTVAQHLSQFGDGAGKTAVVMQLFGRNAQQMIPLLNELGHGFEDLSTEAAALGVLLSGSQLKALQATEEQFNLLGQQVKGVGNELALSLSPALQIVVKDMGDLLNSLSFKNALADVGTIAKTVADNINLVGIAVEALIAKAAAQWFLGVAAGVAATAREAAIGATVWAEMTGAIATTEIAMVGLTAAGEGLLAVIGGVPGLIGLAAFGAYEWASSQDAATKASNSLKEAQDLLNHTTAGSVTADLAITEAVKKKAAAEIADTQALIANLEAQQQANSSAHLGAAAADGAALAYLQTAGHLDDLRAHLAQAQAALDALNKSTHDGATDAKLFGDTVASVGRSFVAGDLSGNMAKFVAASNAIHAAAAQARADGQNAAVVNALEDASIQKLAASLDAAGKAQVTYNAHASSAKAAYDNAIPSLQALNDLLLKSAEAMGDGGEYGKAWNDYINTVHKAVDVENNFIGTESERAIVEARAKEVMDQASASLQARNAAIATSLNLDQLETDSFQKQLDSIKGLGVEQEIEAQYLKDLEIAQTAVTAAYGKGAQVSDEMKASLRNLATAQVQQMDATKASEALLKSWANTLEQDAMGTFNTFLTDIEHGGDVFKDLGKAFENLVNQILAEAFRLLVVGPIINSVFGLSGSNALPNGSIAQGALAKIFGGGGTGTGSFFSGGVPGGAGGAGTDPEFFNGGAAGAGELAYGGPGSSFGFQGGGSAALGIAGGAFAGYNEFNAAGGGIAGLAGGLAYGIGTVAISGALSAGLAAGAAGGMSAGLAAGFAAIPVVGWIALAAMGLNMITGGGLFGTAYKPYGSEENLSVGDSGATISAAIDEKGKKALFGGTKWKTVDQPVDQQTQDSVAAFFTGLQNAANAEAQAFGQTTGDIVEGTFHETFDKAGKMLTQVSTVAGQTYSESITDFQNRILADTLLANMGDASAEAQKIAEQWQSSASDLLAGAEFLSQAQLDINKGHALVQGDTLTDLTTFVTGMEAQGETLIQTYARLSAEVTDVQGILTNLGLDTGKTGEALVKFDDQMVQAAGSLDNLNTLWNDYYNNFYTDSERAAIKLKSDQATVASIFATIGEDPTESMAKFRQDFEAALPTLTPEEVITWLEAGEALAALNKDMGTTVSSTDQLSSFMAQFTTSTLTDFESSIVGMNDTMSKNIDQANSYGASLQQIGQIMAYSAEQGVAAFKQFETQVQSLASSLYGTPDDQLQAQIDALGNDTNAIPFKQYLQAQLDAQKEQEAATKRFSDATTLLQDFGQVGAFTGESLDQIAQQFSVPLDKLGKDLGLSSGQLKDAFQHQEDLANAALNQVDLLTDIRDILEGKPIPIIDKNADVQPLIGGKVSRGGTATQSDTGGSNEVVTAVQTHTTQNMTDAQKMQATLEQILQALNRLNGTAGSQTPPNQRNYRTAVFG